MFKKNDEGSRASSSSSDADTKRDANRAISRATSIIGPTVEFKGELSADEDLVIEGKIEGKIAHHKKNLTIGKHGRIKADIHASSVTIRGVVEGDVHGDELILLAKESRVTGNLYSPRIQMEDGATFRGSMDTIRNEVQSTVVRETQVAGARAR